MVLKSSLHDGSSNGWVFVLGRRPLMAFLNKIALALTEREGRRLVRTITGEGVTVALVTLMQHFTWKQKVVDAGASVWVHAYNGMWFDHRELGMVGAMYELPHTYAELDLRWSSCGS